jgi:hypothetical protein
MSGQKRVKVTIDNKGGFTLEALEGFAGESCTTQTREIEIALGGVEVAEGKTSAYYDGIDDNDVMIKL